MFRNLVILLTLHTSLFAMDKEEVSSWGDFLPTTLVPRQHTRVEVQIKSKVKKINYHMGDSFEKGSLLMELDDTILQSQLKKAQATLSSAEADLQARKRLQEKFAASVAEIRIAEAAVEKAQADLTIARETLAQTRIFAPYTGRVAAVHVELHEYSPAGQPIMTLIDDSVLVARALVRFNDFSHITVGHLVQLQIQGQIEPIQSYVSRLDALIDPISGTARVEIDLPNSQGLLVAGTSGELRFQQVDSKSSNPTTQILVEGYDGQ